jgi:hypothetical protein
VRLSDGDRERLLEALKRHHAEGRLTIPELERRVELVSEAETEDQARPAMADLPILPAPAAGAERVDRVSRRGHGHADAARGDWTPTSERFRDPRSGRITRVWVDAAGGRHYVPD